MRLKGYQPSTKLSQEHSVNRTYLHTYVDSTVAHLQCRAASRPVNMRCKCPCGDTDAHTDRTGVQEAALGLTNSHIIALLQLDLYIAGSINIDPPSTQSDLSTHATCRLPDTSDRQANSCCSKGSNNNAKSANHAVSHIWILRVSKLFKEYRKIHGQSLSTVVDTGDEL